VAQGARVRDAAPLCFAGRDKSKGMRGHIVPFDRLFNVRHVTRDALASTAVFRVMRMLGHRSFETGGILFRVASKAKRIALFDQV
jgi:hypothetical protein